MIRRRWLWFVLIALSVAALRAPQARALDWAVIPFGAPADVADTRAAESLQRALSERRIPVSSMHELKDVFLRSSRDFVPFDASKTRLLMEQRKMALEHAAFGRRNAARSTAEQALQSTAQTPEAVLSDTDSARAVFDSCLALVRIDLQAHDRPLALQEAQRCRGLVPDLSPRESTHSAEVIGVLAEADNELHRAGAGALSIETKPDMVCSAFVNGRRLGTTPFRFQHAPLGRADVFVECGAERSRVHLVQLDEREQRLLIDPRHDARVLLKGVITVSYESKESMQRELVSDAAQLAKTLGGRQVVLVHASPDRGLVALRYDPARQRVVASAQITASQLPKNGEQVFRQTAEALALERVDSSIFPAVPAPSTTQASSASEPTKGQDLHRAKDVSAQPASSAPAHAPRRWRVWTWGLGGATLAASATLLGLSLALENVKDDFHSCLNESTQCGPVASKGARFERARNAMIGIAGALAGATLVSFFVEGREGGPTQAAFSIGPGGVQLFGAF